MHRALAGALVTLEPDPDLVAEAKSFIRRLGRGFARNNRVGFALEEQIDSSAHPVVPVQMHIFYSVTGEGASMDAINSLSAFKEEALGECDPRRRERNTGRVSIASLPKLFKL